MKKNGNARERIDHEIDRSRGQKGRTGLAASTHITTQSRGHVVSLHRLANTATSTTLPLPTTWAPPNRSQVQLMEVCVMYRKNKNKKNEQSHRKILALTNCHKCTIPQVDPSAVFI